MSNGGPRWAFGDHPVAESDEAEELRAGLQGRPQIRQKTTANRAKDEGITDDFMDGIAARMQQISNSKPKNKAQVLSEDSADDDHYNDEPIPRRQPRSAQPMEPKSSQRNRKGPTHSDDDEFDAMFDRTAAAGTAADGKNLDDFDAIARRAAAAAKERAEAAAAEAAAAEELQKLKLEEERQKAQKEKGDKGAKDEPQKIPITEATLPQLRDVLRQVQKENEELKEKQEYLRVMKQRCRDALETLDQMGPELQGKPALVPAAKMPYADAVQKKTSKILVEMGAPEGEEWSVPHAMDFLRRSRCQIDDSIPKVDKAKESMEGNVETVSELLKLREREAPPDVAAELAKLPTAAKDASAAAADSAASDAGADKPEVPTKPPGPWAPDYHPLLDPVNTVEALDSLVRACDTAGMAGIFLLAVFMLGSLGRCRFRRLWNHVGSLRQPLTHGHFPRLDCGAS